MRQQKSLAPPRRPQNLPAHLFAQRPAWRRTGPHLPQATAAAVAVRPEPLPDLDQLVRLIGEW